MRWAAASNRPRSCGALVAESPSCACLCRSAPARDTKPDHGHGRTAAGTMPGSSFSRMPTPLPASADPILDVQGLAFARNEEPVFGPLDFALDRGETLLVEGDNGSGKTTLLRVLAGLLPPSTGEIRLDGEPRHHDALRRRMVFLGHQPGMKNDLSPCENLAFLSGLYGTRDGADIPSALEQVDLAIYTDTP